MRLDDYPKKDGKQVWLEQDELDNLIQEAQTPEQKVAISLGGRCGLRRSEIADLTPVDVVHTHGHHRIRVWEGKRDKYREVPCPEPLHSTIETIAFDRDPDQSIVDCHSTTIWEWVRRAAERRQAATGDKGWKYLDVHDLRRTWGTYLVGKGVIPGLIMQWGGWDDWETFKENYLGEMSPEVDRREQQKVPWLHDGGVDISDPEVHALPAGTASTL